VFSLDTAAFDGSLQQATQRLSAAEVSIAPLEKSLASADAVVQRFKKLAQGVEAYCKEKVAAKQRTEVTTLQQRQTAASQAFSKSSTFDAQPMAEAAALLEKKCEAGELALKNLQAELANAAQPTADFDKLAKRILSAANSGSILEEDAQALRSTFMEEQANLRTALATTLSFNPSALAQARQAIADWLNARTWIVDEVEKRDLAKVHAKWVSSHKTDVFRPSCKLQLDNLLLSTRPASASKVKTLLKLLAATNDTERLEAMNERDQLVEKSKKWGDQKFSAGLLKQVWGATKGLAKGGNGSVKGGFDLADVEKAIAGWIAAGDDPDGAASNLHVPGGGRPQFKGDKDPNRHIIQANFISYWAGNEVDIHVEVGTFEGKTIYGSDGAHIPTATLTKMGQRIT
jgi:hypothetical protein